MRGGQQTGCERLIWAQGSPSSLKAVTTTIAGIKLTLAAAICWENFMPLLRHSLYSQNVNLYLAPTADARDTWLPLMRTVASEGRCVVLSANQCVKARNLPAWIRGSASEHREYASGARSENRSPRRASIVARTEDNHEIVLPNARPSDLVPTTRPNPVVNGHNPSSSGSVMSNSSDDSIPSRRSTVPRRRQSVITKTEDNHEITWPAAAPANGDDTSTLPHRPRRVSIVTKTADNHEITWPPHHHAQSAAGIAQTKMDGPDDGDDYVCRGGSCIVGPTGEVLAGPLWEAKDDALLCVEVDLEDCERGRLDLDVAGSYSRNDAFKLTVQGLDLNPPP